MRVALTFDTEHPGHPYPPGVLDRILEILAGADAHGTFFVQGRWASAHPADARRIVEGGHLVGNHSHHHAPMDALTDEGFRGDVARADETIQAVAGVDPKPWFRCPFGAGMNDDRVLSLLGELGYEHVGWDIDPKDWEEGRTSEELISRVLDGLRGREEAIVLLHSWPGVTADGLPAIVEGLHSEGVELVDLGGLARSR